MATDTGLVSRQSDRSIAMLCPDRDNDEDGQQAQTKGDILFYKSPKRLI